MGKNTVILKHKNLKKVGHGYGGKALCIYVFRLCIPFVLKSEHIQ
jgi:hypothetical protein